MFNHIYKMKELLITSKPLSLKLQYSPSRFARRRCSFGADRFKILELEK